VQIEVLQSLALSVAAARSPQSVLREMVQGLGMSDGVALVRVWLIENDPDGTPYLRLKASVGGSVVRADERWDHTQGAHEKLAVNYGKIGRVAASSTPLLLQCGSADWLLQRDWAEREGIASFAGQPLCFKGEVLGVVAVFSRKRIERHELGWLRVFADHAAVAIANARAFQEIEELKDRLERERDYLRQAVRDALSPGAMIAESPSMKQLLRQVRAVARTEASVLIQGESGVGKELIASAIHDLSARADGPLVKVNCASIPRELFESEFFGHVRGAFSGASRNREGRFQLAHGGTLFLDEVGEIPLELQGKLLRALQERAFEPVGDDRTRHVDIRVIAATNRDLDADVAAGRFREDLLFRLNVIEIAMPALRERPEDILAMARHFLAFFAKTASRAVPELAPEAEAALLGYGWPGNVRELRNAMERAIILVPARLFGIDALPERIAAHTSTAPRLGGEVTLDQIEREHIERVAARAATLEDAARLLGIDASTLYRKRKRYDG